MDANNVVECGFRLKTKVARALAVEAFRPAGDNPLNKLIWFAPYARGHFVPGDATKCIDLLANRARYTGHCKIDSWSQLLSCQTCGVNQKSDSGAWTRVRVANAFGDRQEGFLAGQGLADDAREKTMPPCSVYQAARK